MEYVITVINCYKDEKGGNEKFLKILVKNKKKKK